MVPTSMEEVARDLAYYGDDESTRRVRVEAIYRLPPDVREFACQRCRFSSVGGANVGMVLPGRIGTHHWSRRSRNIWLVLLCERAMRRKDAEAIVGHEIAHAWP